MAEPPRKAAGTVNFQRRTWDKDEYERKAKERLEKDLSGESLKEAREQTAFRAAPPGLKGPEGSARSFVQSRDYDLQLEAKLGKRRLVTDTTPQAQVGGYWCDVCQCTLRDSMAYLDHINGKNHQRSLGFSMRVERSSVDQVKARFDKLKQQKAAGSGAAGRPGAITLDADDRYALAAMDAPSIQMVSADKVSKPSSGPAAAAYGGALSSSATSAAAAAAHSEPAAGAAGPPPAKRNRWDVTEPSPAAAAAEAPSPSSSSSAAASAAETKPPSEPAASLSASPSRAGGGGDDIDPEMAAMMGFSGFGGGKKR